MRCLLLLALHAAEILADLQLRPPCPDSELVGVGNSDGAGLHLRCAGAVGHVVGSDLQDFVYLLSLLDFSERVLFCLDTAHAHAFGYDIVSHRGRQEFFALVDKVIGLHNVAVIHLNDTHDTQGSLLDRHAVIGSGVIGDDALRAFVRHETIAHLPIILEPPKQTPQQLSELIDGVKSW